MGALPDFLPGYQSFEDGGVRGRFEEVWGRALPLKKGLSALQMIREAHRGKIAGMYIMGENPLRSFPDSSFVRGALEKLEFLVIQDLFLTETAQLAQVVLPACSFAEKEGTMTNMERRVQLLRAACEPPAQSLPDWRILLEVSRRMGLAQNYSSPREIMAEVNALVPIYGGITHERLEKGDLTWPCLDSHDPGRPCFPEDGFLPEKLKLSNLPLPGPSGEKRKTSFRLILGSTLYHFGSGTRSARSPRLFAFKNQEALRMNARDAAELGLEEGIWVRISSETKEMAFPLSLDSTLPPGVLFLPASPGALGSVYDLLSYPPEPIEGFPISKTLEVRLERMEA
jgi:predicted molibdopterin-dependent oxidoreductase YjgC